MCYWVMFDRLYYLQLILSIFFIVFDSLHGLFVAKVAMKFCFS